MELFQKTVNLHKELQIHDMNKFNKQFGVLLTEWHYLDIIVNRINDANPEKITQLKLDLKSLYVFCRVFSESLIYLSSIFIDSSSKINWEKIGPFLKTVKENINNEPDSFKDFWTHNEVPINILFETFKYRNYILHEKNSSSEWTFTYPGKSNLDHVFIVNVPWGDDKEIKEERKTLNTREMIRVIFLQSSVIFDYLESRLIK